MNVRHVKFDELTGDELAAWAAIQQSDSLWASPFFRPEFARAVSDVRGSVEAAVLKEGGEPVGFFPFERRSRNRGLPVGTRLSDYHGVVAKAGVAVDPVELMCACRLSSWSFDHLLIRDSSFGRYTFRHADSPIVELSAGYDRFESGLSSHFRSHFRRKMRKLEREVGPIRFEYDSRDPAVLSKMVEWKIQQYLRTKSLNILGFDWVRRLLERILECRGDEFAAVMPAVYAGEKLLAVGYLLRSRQMMHSWFNAYDRDFAGYSTGILLQMKTLQAAAEHGITFLDMGKGPEEYKKQLATGALRVAEGVIDPVAMRARARSAWWAVRSGIQASPLHRLLKKPVQKAFQLHGWLQLR